MYLLMDDSLSGSLGTSSETPSIKDWTLSNEMAENTKNIKMS
jgi:hypothetical protein